MARRKRSPRAGARRVRYAVVGLGHIAQVAMLPAFRHARRNSELVALVSGDARKLALLGRRHGVERRLGYEDYGGLLASGDVDAVYIALPNDMHHAYARRALAAGVHVLCEKPLATSSAECRSLLAAARRRRAKLMTAYRLHFERANLEALALIRAGRLGEPRIFDSVFTMQVRDADNIRLSAERGGGPLWDIGIYCLNAARAVFGAEPLEVACTTASSRDRRFREVDEMAAVTLRFPGERLATFTCSFGAADVSQYRVVGTKGDLCVEPAYEYAEGLAWTVTVGGKERTREFAKRDQFAPELLAFSDWVLGGPAPSSAGAEGLADVRVIEALTRSAERGGAPLRLGRAPAPRRPRLAQVEDLPGVRKPRVVHARAASG